jgi:hypothetical protein
MADVGPKVEAEAFGDDFATAKSDDTRIRHPISQAFQHLSDSLDRLAHGYAKARGLGEEIMRFLTIKMRPRAKPDPTLPVALEARQLIAADILP